MSLTQLKARVMGNDRARETWCWLVNREAGARLLTDEYFGAVQARDEATKLAYEYYIRERAARFCHVDSWRDALAAMERHKARGVMGTAAPRMLQDIADRIQAAYAVGDYQVRDGRYIFDIDRLRVSCDSRPGAVHILAAKYRRGIGKSRAARYGKANA